MVWTFVKFKNERTGEIYEMQYPSREAIKSIRTGEGPINYEGLMKVLNDANTSAHSKVASGGGAKVHLAVIGRGISHKILEKYKECLDKDAKYTITETGEVPKESSEHK